MKEGNVNCPDCGGAGGFYTAYGGDISGDGECKRCDGSGRINWLDAMLIKPLVYIDDYDVNSMYTNVISLEVLKCRNEEMNKVTDKIRMSFNYNSALGYKPHAAVITDVSTS